MIFNALAYPSYFFALDGELIGESSGSLFDIPAAARSPSELQFYSRIRTGGWHKCPLGYEVYAIEIGPEQSGLGTAGRLVLPALRIKGGARSNERMEGQQALVDRGYIVSHIGKVISVTSELAQSFDRITRQNIHELKGINAGIYHAAVRIEAELEAGKIVTAGELSRNISALSQILAARTDFMTFIADAGLADPEYGPVQVYKKFDRMQKCFTAQTKKGEVSISIGGSSFASAYGPKNFLDLAAYILIDNAVKYSPPREMVAINVVDQSKSISVTVASIGPRIEESEAPKIFERDVRSGAAERSGISGSGIGLYALKNTIIQAFNGSIAVEPGIHVYDRAGVPYDRVTFRLELPIY
jgi:signal transduction histidine kinase